MKAISVKQPWASLIISGIKDIENRKWKTNYRGRVLIHASNSTDLDNLPLDSIFTPEQILELKQHYSENVLSSFIYPHGLIIGSVEIIDCVTNHTSIWAEKSRPLSFSSITNNEKPIYNWVLKNPIKFEKPIPAKGKLSFWEFNLEEKK